MCRRLAATAFVTLFGISALVAQDEEAVTSGPKPGETVPAAFEALNVNGPAKGRYHCLVCRYHLNPVVMVFAREPGKGGTKGGNDEGLAALAQKLEELAEELQEKQLGATVVYLSPDARSSLSDPKEADPEKLVQEAADRQALLSRLGASADKLKNVIVAVYPPEGPKGFKLNPKADVTVLFYQRLKVIDNKSFAGGALRAEDVDAIVGKVRKTLAK